MHNCNEVGRGGEERAVRYLKKKGYRILERNYRTHGGEIDIIARFRRILCFIEVKSRKNAEYGWPEEYIHSRKQRILKKTALLFMEDAGICGDTIRFDVVAITGDDVELIEGAF